MSETYISQFIDDELDLDEKIDFVEIIHSDSHFKTETIELLLQEKALCDLPEPMPMKEFRKKFRPRFAFPIRPWWHVTVGFAIAGVLLFAFPGVLLKTQTPVKEMNEHRFVVYLPEKKQLSVVGSFTDWQAVPMQKIGTTGYWSISLELPAGEHRYSFVIDNEVSMPDPTVAAREKDDFGGVNSILTIGDEHDPFS